MSGKETGTFPASVPQPNLPFVDPGTGLLSRQGYYFLLSLFNRTGGSSAPVDFAMIQKQIASLFVEQAMADEPEPANIAPALLLAWAGDPEPPAPLNPILAALFVSDAA